MRKYFRIIGFSKFNPSGAAASKHRERTIIFNPVYEFRNFFHYCEIGSKVSIEDFFESQASKSSNELTCNIGTQGEIIFLSEGSPDSRCNLNDNVFGFIS